MPAWRREAACWQAVITAKAQSSGNDQKTYYFFCDTDNDATNNNMASGSIVTAVAYPETTDTVTDNSATTGLWNLGSHADCVVYAYDRLGRKTSMTDQRQVTHAYAYSTTTGALLSDTATGTWLPLSVDATIRRIGYTYDNFGRTTKVTSYSDTGGSTVINEVAFEYGAWGVVTKSIQDHYGATAATDPNVQYAYEDGSGGADLDANFVRVDYVTYPGPTATRRVYYNYPDGGIGAVLSRLDNIASAGSPSASEKYAAYGYFGASTMIKVEYPAVPGDGESLALTYGTSANSYSGFDRFGRTLNQKWGLQSAGTVTDQFKYAYDRAGNRLSRDVAPDAGTPPAGLDHYYTYDGLDRLTQSNRGDLDGGGVITDQNADANQAWTLDTVGNWSGFKWDADGGGAGSPVLQDRAHNTANEIAGNGGNPIYGSGAANWVDPAYDEAGNMTKGPQPGYEAVDANAQLYRYDAWNRLVKVYRDADQGGDMDPSEWVVEYRYDGLNRRIRKFTPVAQTQMRLVREYYYNESWQMLEVWREMEIELNEEDPPPPNNEPPVMCTVHEQYIWGAQYSDAPVARLRDTDSDGQPDDETLYYMYDGNFNVTGLVEPNGDVAERYTYDPYGKVTFKNAAWADATNQAKSAYDNEILYCGYRFDPESGLYQVRYRYLHSTLGRCVTRDPIRYADGMSLYEYVRSSPIMAYDPYGLWYAEGNYAVAVIAFRKSNVTTVTN